VEGYWKWDGSEMWIMVEPVAEILFGIHQSPMWCYGCNRQWKSSVGTKHYVNPFSM
jgi:hypothetical protein